MTTDAQVRTDSVLFEHAYEISFLWSLRTQLSESGGVTFEHIRALDERIDAHIDGLRLGGQRGWEICRSQLTRPEPGELFAAMLLAANAEDSRKLLALFALAEAVPAMQLGAIEALAWISMPCRHRIVRDLLASESPARRKMALECCLAHRINPGTEALVQAVQSEDLRLRAAALRAVGELGQRDLLTLCEHGLTEEAAECQLAGARSMLLLGSPGAIEKLWQLALSAGPCCGAAQDLCLLALPMERARQLYESLSTIPAFHPKSAVLLGDPALVPDLIEKMRTTVYARAAAEALSLITGVDLRSTSRTDERPEPFNTTTDDHGLALDSGIDAERYLPWPDVQAIEHWWHAKRADFASGERHLAGKPISEASCRRLLNGGWQRQRGLAALRMALLTPGCGLFPTTAPAREQQRLLAEGTSYYWTPLSM